MAERFTGPPTAHDLREAIRAGEALDWTLRQCARVAAGQMELTTLLRANDLRDWADRPGLAASD